MDDPKMPDESLHGIDMKGDASRAVDGNDAAIYRLIQLLEGEQTKENVRFALVAK